MNTRKQLVASSLQVLVLLAVGISGALVLTTNGTTSPSKMIENTGTIGGVIGYRVKAPHEVNVGEHFKVTIEVYKQFPGAIFIEYIEAYAFAGWTWQDTLASNVNLTGGVSEWHATKNATTTYPLAPSTLGSRVKCTLIFSLYDSSLDYNEKDVLTFSLSLITKKTDGAGGVCSLNTQILTGVLVGTTLIFMSTTLYFARRKPRIKTEIR